jgi:subtilisin-like proprotein convertase family protein
MVAAAKRTAESVLTIENAFEIADVNVQLDITHTRDKDLDVYLMSPAIERRAVYRPEFHQNPCGDTDAALTTTQPYAPGSA